MTNFLVTVLGSPNDVDQRQVYGTITIQARDAKRARVVALALPPNAITWDTDNDPARIIDVARIEAQP